jgi:hypothetical protein
MNEDISDSPPGAGPDASWNRHITSGAIYRRASRAGSMHKNERQTLRVVKNTCTSYVRKGNENKMFEHQQYIVRRSTRRQDMWDKIQDDEICVTKHRRYRVQTTQNGASV